MTFPECPYCHKVLKITQEPQLQHHYTTCKEFVQHVHHMNDGTKQCTLCGRHFKNQAGIYTHLGKIHFQGLVKNDPLIEECQICDQPYQSVSKHLELCAKYNECIEKWNNRWRCTRCGKVTDTQVGMFNHHTKIHKKEDLNKLLFDEARKLGIDEVLQNFENDQPGQQVHPERSSPRRPLKSISRPNVSVTEVSVSAARPFLGLVQALDSTTSGNQAGSGPMSTPQEEVSIHVSNKRPYSASYCSPTSSKTRTFAFGNSRPSTSTSTVTSDAKVIELGSQSQRPSSTSTPSSTPLQFFENQDSRPSISSPEPLVVARPKDFPELNTEEESNHSFSYLDDHDPQPSTSQGLNENVQQPGSSNDQDDDSDIEIIEEVEVKPKVTNNAMSTPKVIELGSQRPSSSTSTSSSQPEQPTQHQPMERLESGQNEPSAQDNPDTQSDLLIDDKEAETPAETDDEKMESKGFVGAVLKLYYCNFCDTPFQTQAYVIDHLKKYHKIPKNYAKHMSVKNL